MSDETPLLTLVQPNIADLAHFRSVANSALQALAPGLDGLGDTQIALRGDRLPPLPSRLGLRLVTRGVLCLTHGETGLCTAMVGEGDLAGPSSGQWLTDGALVDIPIEALSERFGGATALTVGMRAADLSRASIEMELVCFVRHAASRRLGRWLLALMKDADTTLMTQTELARLAGLQRTSVCAAMATLQMRGALKVTRGRIVLKDRAALEREACRCGVSRCPASQPAQPSPAGEVRADTADATLRFAGQAIGGG